MSKKIKTGIVTFHFVNNFGAALQAYALMRAIEDNCNSEVEIVDYRHWFIRFTDAVRILPITTNVKEICAGIKTIPLRLGRLKKFKQFHNSYYKMTKRYNFFSQLRNNGVDCDKYVCGSDQIWNPVITFGVAEPYYLGFEKQKENKISYAPSFGVSEINPRYKKAMKNYIENIGAISVREREAIGIVKDLVGQDAVQLIDPTFLIDKEEWSQVAVNPKIKGKYILLYIMQRNEVVYEYARKLKEKLGLPIVEISRYGYNPGFVDEILIDVGPREWVGLIENAEFVCTNSFHGLAFSIIFEKNYYLIPSKKFNSRMESLLKLFELESSCEIEKVDLTKEKFDKDKILEILERERNKSRKYFGENIS